MEKLIRVSNTNSNGSNMTAVRVYLDNELIAEVNPNKRNPLDYIRIHNGKYRQSLLEQWLSAGLTQDEFNYQVMNKG